MKIEIKKINRLNWNGVFVYYQVFLDSKKLWELEQELKGDDAYNFSSFSEEEIQKYFKSNMSIQLNNEKLITASTDEYSSIEEFKKAGWFDELENEVIGILEDIDLGLLNLQEDF
jgi:hypothetical protein